MNKRILIAGLGIVVSGILATGCAVEARGPHGEVVVGGSAPDVYVAGPPPAPLDDPVIGVAPGPDYVWVGGGWGWDHNRWAWDHGRWDRPPRAGMQWSPHHYEYRNGRHTYVRGHWH